MVFGTYCEAYEKPYLSKTMTPHTHESIYLVSTININDTYIFLVLKLGVSSNASIGLSNQFLDGRSKQLTSGGGRPII